MVTRILFDPRRDLPDGTTQSNPVIVSATPTGIAENGSIVILPTTLTFTINTGADMLQLPPSVASWAWRLVVRDQVTNAILQQRTCIVPDAASVAWQTLQDVDPATLQVTTGTARQWDATYAQLLDLIAGLTSQVLDAVDNWEPNTAYPAGTVVLNPSQQFVQANATFTSGSTYDQTKWTTLTLNLAGVQALIAAQAASDSATYSTLANARRQALIFANA